MSFVAGDLYTLVYKSVRIYLMRQSSPVLSKSDHEHYQTIIDKLTHENQQLRAHIDKCLEC